MRRIPNPSLAKPNLRSILSTGQKPRVTFMVGDPVTTVVPTKDVPYRTTNTSRKKSELPSENITPLDRIPFWKKKWGSSRLLDDATVEAAFEELQDALVPGHMHKQFYKLFWSSKPKFDNRFFVDEASFRNWDTKFSDLAHSNVGAAEAIVIYGSPDRIEGHFLKGQMRRSLRDVMMDDWHPACAIVRTGEATLYLFVSQKMQGCIVRVIGAAAESGD